MTRDHHVGLLVPQALLGVLLDDVITGGCGAVGVDPECVDPEGAPKRRPADACDRDLIALVDVQHRVGLRHVGKRISASLEQGITPRMGHLDRI